MAHEASSIDSMIAEARDTQADGKYVNGHVFHALVTEIERLRAALNEACELLREARSGYVGGSSADEAWGARGKELLRSLEQKAGESWPSK